MRKIRFIAVVLFALLPLSGSAAAKSIVLQAEDAKLDSARAEVVAQDTFQGKQGVALKSGQKASGETENTAPDLVFTVRIPAGRYSLVTHAATDETGKALMRAATSKFASLSAWIQIDRQRPTSRIVFVPWSRPDSCSQNLGIFELNGEAQAIKFWLPAGVKLDRLEVYPYRSPVVPKEAAEYRPSLVPPPSHPRLWGNSNSFSRVRANLRHPENRATWKRVITTARAPFTFNFDPKRELGFNMPLETAAAYKAFAYLMEGDRKLGREAVQLMLDYLPRVEFGNMLDITREVGAAIYTGARVYDWCYGLCTPAERETLRLNLMRLAEKMECGWPPFKGSIINGHGNEAMINRDLLSMAIAIYDEDPQPYQYCSYLELEQLVPMRRFEYQSPRHNQGVNYSSFRFGWEMQAAWLLRFLAGQEVFDPNIKTVPNYWLYMRLPNGEMLRDGDGVSSGRYWASPQTMLLCYSYSGDPILKGEFQRQSGQSFDPLLYLLLNDPALKAEPSLDSLPRTIDFGPVLSGMIARTGWNVGTNSDDVVAEIKGGGFHFGNHQHADAGALQIYYRGLQVCDLGHYKFYGTPFDMNFNKRSIAHSMVLVIDPQEKFLHAPANDGGSRFLQAHPRTPEQVQGNPLFHYGKKISCSFGPSAMHPDFSYFSADLRSAYSEKISSFVRSFCFLNLNNSTNPAAIILLDDIRAANPEFKKYWQVNTLNPPQLTPVGVQLHNSAHGNTGQLDVCMLWPKPEDRTVEVKSGPDTYNVFGQNFTPPLPSLPEGHGHRVLFSPKRAQAQDRFLTVIQACADKTPVLPCVATPTDVGVAVRVADRIVSFALGPNLISTPFSLTVPEDGKVYQVLLAGMEAGAWRVTTTGGLPVADAKSEPGKNTAFFSAKGGVYRIAPL